MPVPGRNKYRNLAGPPGWGVSNIEKIKYAHESLENHEN
jgi:hypothetical protein